jgi:ParB family chromosome partitioning protein
MESVGARRNVAVDQIEPNPRQPRQTIRDEALEALADSIRRHGVLQPLLVISDELRVGIYVLVAGERRWRAARMAGLAEVPVTVISADEQEQLELALVENLQRADLGPLERASAYRALMEEFGLNQAQVAERLSVSRPAVANAVRLLELDAEAQAELAAGRLSEGHARALLGVSEGEARRDLLRTLIRERLSVREVERRVRETPERKGAPVARQVRALPDPELEAVIGRVQQRLGTRVLLQGTGAAGRVVIEYYSAEELDGLITRLLQA